MDERDTILRLGIGVLIAVILHALLVPVSATLLFEPAKGSRLAAADATSRAEASEDHPPQEDRDDPAPEDRENSPPDREHQKREPREQHQPPRDPVVLGSDEGRAEMTVAWISHDAFEELQAMQAETLQPALQTQVEAMPEAPVRDDDITPPAPYTPQVAMNQMARPGGEVAAPMPTESLPESESVVPLPGPAAEQSLVVTPSTEGDTATRQAAASAAVTFDHMPATEQEAADAPLEAIGTPSQQDEINPVAIAAAAEDGPVPEAVGEDLSLSSRDGATGPDVDASEPMMQIAASTDDPDEAGVPTQRDPAESDEEQPGDPVAQLASAATRPDPSGQPTTNPPGRERDPAAAAQPGDAPGDGSASDVEAAPEDRDDATRPASDAPSRANPTSTPRAEAESPPTGLEGTLVVRAGRVITAPGIEINTALPTFSAVTRATSLPHNPLVRLTFDQRGDVIDAQIIRSSSYDTVDAPVLASLYKWKATGRHFEDRGRGFSIIVQLLLGGE